MYRITWIDRDGNMGELQVSGIAQLFLTANTLMSQPHRYQQVEASCKRTGRCIILVAQPATK